MAIVKIEYGTEELYLDVTEKALSSCVTNGVLELPDADIDRARIFTDPVFGKLKHIKITFVDRTEIYPSGVYISVDITTGEHRQSPILSLLELHQRLKLNGGSMKDEFPEQVMAVTYIKPDNVVLEIGGNIGRNSLVIANLLSNQSNLVVLESSPQAAEVLSQNRELNECTFHIEPSALSLRKLAQRGWDTIPCDDVPPGWHPVNTINFIDLEAKYGLKFDTLVADCEGALYYIFADMPEMLDNIKLVIMENDYHDINKKHAVDAVLQEKGLHVVYSRPGPWGACMANFFEVWSK